MNPRPHTSHILQTRRLLSRIAGPPIGLATALAATAAAQASVLDPAGPVGAAQKTILVNALLIMLGVVVPTIAAALGCAWWFRAGNPRAKRRPDFAYSGRVELVTWSIPVLVILFLGGIAWVGSHDLEPSRPLASGGKPLTVQVVSLDWKWLFVLPDEGVASVNELVIPVGRPVAFALTSASVMNTFFVPRLGSMIYTMNGMTNRLHLQADEAGTFMGLSGHFSGDGFPGMRFAVRAVPDAEFAAWVNDAKGKGETLDRATYAGLARQSSDVAPKTYRGVEAGLFEAIVTQAIPPAPGPERGRPDPGVSPRSAARDGDGRPPDFAGAICTPSEPRGVRIAAQGG